MGGTAPLPPPHLFPPGWCRHLCTAVPVGPVDGCLRARCGMPHACPRAGCSLQVPSPLGHPSEGGSPLASSSFPCVTLALLVPGLPSVCPLSVAPSLASACWLREPRINLCVRGFSSLSARSFQPRPVLLQGRLTGPPDAWTSASLSWAPPALLAQPECQGLRLRATRGLHRPQPRLHCAWPLPAEPHPHPGRPSLGVSLGHRQGSAAPFGQTASGAGFVVLGAF